MGQRVGEKSKSRMFYQTFIPVWKPTPSLACRLVPENVQRLCNNGKCLEVSPSVRLGRDAEASLRGARHTHAALSVITNTTTSHVQTHCDMQLGFSLPIKLFNWS